MKNGECSRRLFLLVDAIESVGMCGEQSMVYM